MCKRNDRALFFTCSLIEQMGRTFRKKRGDVAKELGDRGIRAIYEHEDVLHCEPIEKVAEDAAEEFSIKSGNFDNISTAMYLLPDVWTIGKVYSRLIEDVSDENNIVETLLDVYSSWIDEKLSDYNTSFYYQPRDYIAECYRQGTVLDG